MDCDQAKVSEVLSTNPNGRSGSFGYRRNSKANAARPDSKENMNVAASDSEGGDRQSSLPRGNTNANNRPQTIASQIPTSATKLSNTRLPRLNSDVGVPVSYTPDSSPHDSRIPRPKTTASVIMPSQNSPGQSNKPPKQFSGLRQPMSLKSAFKLAQEQEAEDATIDLNQAFNMAHAEADRDVDGSPSPAPRTYRSKRDLHDIGSRNVPSSRRGNDLGQQLQKFDRNHQLGRGSGPLTGLFSKNRPGPAANPTGHALAKKASNSSLDSTSGNHRLGRWNGTPARNKENRIPAESTTSGSGSLNSDHGDNGGPIPSIELNSPSSEERPSFLPRPFNPSPEKSFNWHLDADFTAGDLQISDSPRVRTGQTNGGADSPQDRGTPRFRQSNNKLEQIREREARAESIPIREDSLSPSSRRNTKLDEIRAREKEALSKRAVATSRLDEIKAKNSEARSESPDTERRSSRSSLGSDSVASNHQPKSSLDDHLSLAVKSGTSNDLPTDSGSKPNDAKNSDLAKELGDSLHRRVDDKQDYSSHDDSHELLHRLAKAARSPPSAAASLDTVAFASTGETPVDTKSDEKETNQLRSKTEEPKFRDLESKSSRERPSVEFVGLKHIESSESLKSKKDSKPNSEADPTDRIEAEMKLFAPQDNYSERGSVRAPSPLSADTMEEETPRAIKVDPMSLPTPRVTGAYVETPATVKVKDESDRSDKIASDSVLHTSRSLRRVHDNDSKAPARTTQRRGSDGSTSAVESQARSSSAPTKRRQSICRRRRQPLINTAKPPSAKDDIRAILRRHEIDDSTLEDFDDRLAKHEIDPDELKQMVEESKLKAEENPDDVEMADGKLEEEPYHRMSKSLKTLLTDIRTAKHGIERLEDKVTHTEHKPQVAADQEKPSPEYPLSPGSGAVFVALPALWRREPKFKFTPLGLISALLAIWWSLELVFSHFYDTPRYCTPSLPCDWSPNEPYYPYTMPFMVDEWVTGGQGRAWVFWIGEELGDYAAEIYDWITESDLTQRDQRFMGVWERKRHRRRLRKHGLVPQWSEPPKLKPIRAQLEASRRAREEAEELADDIEWDESMSADEWVKW